MTNKIKQILLTFLLLTAVGGFSYAQALTYSQLTGQGKVLGDTVNGFYPYPTGTLVNDSGTIYFISGTTKVPFTSWQAFVGLGYSSKNVVEGDLTNYSPSAGYTINTPNAEHPWGSWLIYKGTVYYSTSDGLVGVPSSSVFISNGGDWTYIVKANKYDIAVLSAHQNLPVLTLDDTRVNSAPTYQFGNNPGNSTSSQMSIAAPSSNFTQATVGKYYSSSFTVSPESKSDGSQIQYSFSFTGNLPPGLSSSTNYCPPNLSCAAVVINNVLTIYGTPTQAGTYTFNVNATDKSGNTASVPFTLTVNNAATGNSLLTTTLNGAFTGGSVSAGNVSQKIGSYLLTASSIQAVNLSSLSITVLPQGGQVVFQNLVVKANGVQFGQVQGTVTSAYVYPFNGTVNIPANGTVIIDVYADVLSNASAALNPATAISGCTAFSATTSTAANCSAINGQNIAIGSQTSGARVGQLVNINSTVYYVGSNGLYGIPSLDVFNSWGWSFANVLPANSIEQSLSQAGIVPMKQAGCNSPIDQINGTCTTVGSPSITVTAPISGSLLVPGQTYNITWNSTGVQTVKLQLCATSQTLGYICMAISGPSTNYNASLGSYSFYVDPNAPFVGNVVSSGVKIRITDVASGVYGESAPFSIAASNTQATNTQLNFTVDAASPVAATVAPGTPNVVFSVWDITATGGNGSLSAISIGSDSPNAQSNLSNIRIYQGTNLLGSAGSLANITSVNGFSQAWGSVSFSNLSIPLNGVVTLRVLADVSSAATGSTKLGIIGLGFGTTGSATSNLTSSYMAFGNAMTFGNPSSSSALSVTVNSNFTGGTVTQGVASQKIGSYILTASTGQGLSVSSLALAQVNGGGAAFQNLMIKVNGAQFGQVQGVVSPGSFYPFTANVPVNIPAGGTATVDIYADVLMNASLSTINSPTTALEACSVNGVINSACSSSVNGQSVQIVQSSTGNSAATITLSTVASSLTTGIVILGKITVAASAASDVTLQTLPVSISVTGGITLSGNIIVRDDAAQINVPTSNSYFSVAAGSPGSTTINFSGDNVIAAGNSKTYYLDATQGGTLGGSGRSSVTIQLGASSAIITNSTGVASSITNPTNQVTVHN